MKRKNGFLLGVVKSLSGAVCGVATLALLVASNAALGWDSKDFVVEKDGVYSICLKNAAGDVALRSPAEGLWSVATAWENGAPSGWKHIQAKELRTFGDATILTGELELDGGKLSVRDVYSLENGLLKCVRRFDYVGEKDWNDATLSVRFEALGERLPAFLPGIVYYGNPSGAKNTPNGVARYFANPGEFAIFEEHRFPEPFVCLENAPAKTGVALYTRPTPALRGSVQDQWWSAGVRATAEDVSELVLYSGFIGYNGQNSVAKALQARPMEYPKATLRVIPKTTIEKTFYLDVWAIEREGTAFQKPVEKAIELFQPFYCEDLPTTEFILKSKFEFAKSRWFEGEVDGKKFAGFNMYPDFMKPRIVTGWCGQADSLGFAFQELEDVLVALYPEEERDANRAWIRDVVQRSLDFLSTSPVTEAGFSVEFEPSNATWRNVSDPVSMGQCMYNFAKAIESARENKIYNTSQWETFLKAAALSAANRVLKDDWKPRSTAEGFYVAPLILSYKLFGDDVYKQAAEKAAATFADRHLSMREPYWGGTLDAKCEDKEGAWAAFQGFLTMYDVLGDEKYLAWAEHAADVCISYLMVWDVPLPPGRMSDFQFKTRGWTVVSAQNQHIDVYGVLFAPEIKRLGKILGKTSYERVAEPMFRSCGQLIDVFGSQGEQLQHTNFAQQGDMSDVLKLRGGYSESWTVFWITTHFLNAAARFEQAKTNE